MLEHSVMKRTKHGLVILLTCVALLLLLLAACGDADDDAGGVGDAPPATSTPATGAGAAAPAGDAEAGRAKWQEQCAMCHTLDGGEAIGPTWQGLWMSQVALEDGTMVTVDDAYIAESIREPNAKIVQGFAGIMPVNDLDDADIANVIAFIQTLQ